MSLARHRLDWLFMEKRTNLLDCSSKRLLHVAPELGMSEKFRKLPRVEYVAGDLASPLADVKIDLTDLQFPDQHFDAIYCSHVLEHIQDDLRAIRELQRVCKSSGWAILQVPITVETTFEDPMITDPQERLAVFGQEDHVRRCGPDYADRLTSGGFETTTIYARELLDPDECRRNGVTGDLLIFFCRPVRVSSTLAQEY